MKIKLSILTLISVLLFSCKKSDNSATCDIPSFSVTAEGTEITIYPYAGYGFYEVEYGPNGFAKGTGTKKTIAQNAIINNLTLGTYDIYIRGNCGGNSYSDWSAPQSFLIDGSSSTCAKPSSLSANTSGSAYYFSWYGFNDYYDIEFGLTGFTLGTGTRIRTNNNYTTAADLVFESGKTYDFYIRGNCGSSTFSSWEGPKSFFADDDQNVTPACSVPTNITAYKPSNREIRYEFIGHGGISYQISFSTSSTTYSNIIDTDYSTGTYGFTSVLTGNYYFWVRTKCSIGVYTDWVVTPVL
jgi:hypothetical protein